MFQVTAIVPQVIATQQQDVSDAPCYSQSVQAKAVSSSRPPLPRDLQKPFLRTSLLNYKADCISQTTPNGKNERMLKRLQHTTSEASKETSVSSNKPGNTKKHCRHCERKSSLQNQFYKEAKIPSKDIHQEQQHHQQSRGGQAMGLLERKDFDCFPTSLSMGVSKPEVEVNPSGQLEKPEWENDFSKEVSDSIKQIESYILAFQLMDPIKNAASETTLIKKNISVDPVKQMLARPSSTNQMSDAVRSFVDGNETQSWKKVPPTSRNENLRVEVQLMQSQYRKPSLAGNDPTSQMTNLLARPSVKSTVRRIESLSLPRSENNQMTCYVHGLRVPLSQDDSSTSLIMHEKAPSQSIPVHNPVSQKGTNRKGVRSKPSVGPDHKLNWNFTHQTNRSKKDPQQLVVKKPTPLDQKSSEIIVSPTSHTNDFGRVEKRTKRRARLCSRKITPHHHELEESSSISFPSSSTWSTQSNCFSNSKSETEEYPAPSHRRRARQVRSPSLYSNPESEESSLPTKTCKSKQGKTSQKGFGRLRRFKNKLGLIFHHHHHHHHHHHNEKYANNHYDTISSHHQRSTWKGIQRKIFHGKNKAGINVELGAAKPIKSTVVKVSKDHRVGQLHAFVEGLFRHFRRSKKSKRSKGEMARISKNIKTHGHNNKMVKRFHWWQMYRRHGGMKLPKRRGRVKLGFANKRPKLKMK